MDIVNALLLILGGIIALSGVILLKRPDLKPQLDKLIPFSALIGVGLIVLGLYNFLTSLDFLTASFRQNQIFAAAVWIMLLDSVLVGGLFGWPLIESWIPQHSPAKPKMRQITQNLAVFQVLLGLVGLAASLVYLLFRFKILSMTGYFGGNS